MTEINNSAILYRFLSDSKFRIWRHILLVLVLAIISFNQILYLFSTNADKVGNLVYLICFVALALYIFVAYFNIYVLEPKLLLKKKYASYAIALFSSVAVIIFMRSVVEYQMGDRLGFSTELSTYISPYAILNNLSYCAIVSICIFGTSISVLLKHFITESQHVAQLEKEHIQSEVVQLKEQIAPDFLSQILNYTSVLVKTEPKKASTMLMKLSQLLRYQLYDANRDKVLLNSAIKFIDNYLSIVQLYDNKITYSISTRGNTSKIFITPLLLFSFVRYAVNQVSNQPNEIEINLQLEVNEQSYDKMIFTCSLSDDKIALDGDDFSTIRKRLDLLYADNYKLNINREMILLQLNSIQL